MYVKAQIGCKFLRFIIYITARVQNNVIVTGAYKVNLKLKVKDTLLLAMHMRVLI